ncbi:MAG TPA: Mur ligase domain-containing protein, partial [Nocardioides sp.]|nr:Mur ligase domain-containing protein [Nocardioides sp.]
MLSDATEETRPRHPVASPLADLAAWLGEHVEGFRSHGDLSATATGVSLSSQRVRPGDVYAAVPGGRAHGIDYADAAVEAGAVAVLTDEAGAARAPEVPLLVVERPRTVLGRFAARVYGDPAASLRVVGVTGTQGKTTTTRLMESGLQQAGVSSAAIGTVGTRVAGVDVKTSLTTPEAPDL